MSECSVKGLLRGRSWFFRFRCHGIWPRMSRDRIYRPSRRRGLTKGNDSSTIKSDNILKSNSTVLFLEASCPFFSLLFPFPPFSAPPEPLPRLSLCLVLDGNAGGACTIKSIFYQPKERSLPLSFSPRLLFISLCTVLLVGARVIDANQNYFLLGLSEPLASLPRERPWPLCSAGTSSDRILMTFHASSPGPGPKIPPARLGAAATS